MRTLLRLLPAAAVLSAAVTACGQSPTAPQTEIATARRDGGGFLGGGGRITDGGPLTITISGDSTAGCLVERGGGFFGGGSYIGKPCE